MKPTYPSLGEIVFAWHAFLLSACLSALCNVPSKQQESCPVDKKGTLTIRCDTNSALKGNGKLGALKWLLTTEEDMIDMLGEFGAADLIEEVLRAVEAFVCQLYQSGGSCTDVNALRAKLYSPKHLDDENCHLHGTVSSNIHAEHICRRASIGRLPCSTLSCHRSRSLASLMKGLTSC